MTEERKISQDWRFTPTVVLTALVGTFLLNLLKEFTNRELNPVEVFSHWQFAVNFFIFWMVSFAALMIFCGYYAH